MFPTNGVSELTRANILMVDDRPPNILALEAILRPLGHRLVRAHSGEEALKHLLEEDFAVILMDVQMPGMDGYQTVEMIKQRERCRQVPIIFITAINKAQEHIIKGYSCGAVDYVLKPFEPFVLRSKVSVFVDLFLREQQLRREEAALRHREREAEIRRSDNRIRSLIESIPLCVWATRPDGNVHYCNRIWMESTGMTTEETANLGFLEAVRPDFRRPVQSAWLESIRTGRPFEMEFPLRQRRDDSHRWHLGRAVPERDEKGNITGWIATATDIDAQKRAEEERTRLLVVEQQSRSAAEAANRTKDEFLATVSHELRNPLNAILGWARMVRSGKLEPYRVDQALETIERNAQVQAKLVEEILDMSRIVTGKVRLQLRPIRLSSVINAAVDTVRPAAEAKDIDLAALLDFTADEFLADPDRLQQVVWNLLSNAIKFTHRGGRVEIQACCTENEMEIRVSDTGIGIESKFLDRIFDRFRQVDSTTTRAHGGLGLGLAIVRHLVELHGGTVRAESKGVGKGAVFIVQLPSRHTYAPADAPEERVVAPQPLSDLPRLDGVRVLFVDDQADARELATELLEAFGAQVIAVDSAAKAYQEVKSHPPHVLVSDIGLPHEDGYSLIRGIRSLEASKGGQIPALAVTGFAGLEDGRRALAEGFQLHLPKPIDPAELVTMIAKLAAAHGPVVQPAAPSP